MNNFYPFNPSLIFIPKRLHFLTTTISSQFFLKGIVPPMQTNVQPVQPLLSGLPAVPPLANTGFVQPMAPIVPPTMAPLIPGVPSTVVPPTVAPLIPGVPSTGVPPGIAPLIPGVPPVVGTVSPVTVQSTGASGGPSATSTPRASVASLDRTHSTESNP